MATLPGAKISDLAKATNITDSDELELRQGGNKALSWSLIKSLLSAAIVTWDNITGKPSTFPPSAHIHAIADVTGLQTALDAKRDRTAVASSVYITDASGNQAVGTWATTATAGTFARRNSDGTLTVATPVNATDASTKAYTDSLYNALNIYVDRRLIGPFNNVMSDSGKMSGREYPLSYLCFNAFDNTYMTRFFTPYNGGTAWAEVGKYIFDNTTNGGTRGVLTQTTIDLQNKLGRNTAILARYGVEYYIAQRVSGAGTQIPGPVGATDKYLFSTNSLVALFASNKKGTVSFWVRCIDGTSIAFNASNGNIRQVYKNGVLTTGVQFVTVAEGWTHIRIVVETSSGYDNAYPQIYAEPNQTVQIALPSWFTGEVDTGLQASPIPHQTMWNDLDAAYVKTSGNENIAGVKRFTNQTIRASGADMRDYNTADETTNTEYANLGWVSNVYTLSLGSTGTGVARQLNLHQNIRLRLDSFPFCQLGYTPASGGAGPYVRVSTTPNASSAVQTIMDVAPAINQSGTAGYTAFDINPTETAVGTGVKLLQRWATGGTARAQLTNIGQFSAIALRAGAVGVGVSILESSSSFGAGIATFTVNSTLTSAHYTALVDASGGARTITLPAAATAPNRIYNIKKIDSSVNNVTIAANGAETIDGTNTKVISTQWTNIQLQCNGTAWFITSVN